MDEEKLAVLSELCIFRPDGQEVKTSPFHGGNPGSIPGRVTNKRSTPQGVLFLMPTGDRSQTWVIGVVYGSGGALHSRSSAQRRRNAASARTVCRRQSVPDSRSGHQQKKHTARSILYGSGRELFGLRPLLIFGLVRCSVSEFIVNNPAHPLTGIFPCATL